jgi:hypothetical protein
MLTEWLKVHIKFIHYFLIQFRELQHRKKNPSKEVE